MIHAPIRPLLAFALLAALLPAGLRAAPEYPAKGPDIYDTHADGSAQIARRSRRRPRSTSGCSSTSARTGASGAAGSTRRSSRDPSVSEALGRGFVVVMIDVNTRNGVKRNAGVNERYGDPIRHGIPVLVVLDSDGKQLTTKDSGELEEGEGHSPAKINAFLAAWAPTGRP